MTATVGGNAPTPQQKTDLAQAFDLVRVNAQGQTIGPDGQVVGGGALARVNILDNANAGTSTAWLPIAAYPERLAYQLDSGSAATTFSVDISADGVTSLGQAFTGTWARSDLAELTPPLMFSNPQARFFRFNVLSGGPLSVSRGY
jgi:hypothetical protein